MSRFITMLATAVLVVAGCATAPRTATDRETLQMKVDTALYEMNARDPGLASVLSRAEGYVVFPEIAKAGIGVGGAWGRGILFVHGERAGYVKLSQGSLGAQLGGQAITEVIVFRDHFTIDRLRAGTFELGAAAEAVVIKAGAAATVRFADGIAVFALPRGAMYELSVSGQKLSFEAG
jgi:lipid-binding SYLF domain-containing protein